RRGARGPHPPLEYLLGEILEVAIDRELNRATGPLLHRHRQLGQQAAAARVAQRRERRPLAAEILIEGALESLEPLAVGADEAEDLRRELLLRIEAPGLAQRADAAS